MGSRSAGTSTPPTAPISERTPSRTVRSQRSATPARPSPRTRDAQSLAPIPSPSRSAEAIVGPRSSDRDVRAKRPPLVSFVVRADTLRRALAVVSLLALDFAGIALAIFTALALKEAVLNDVDLKAVYEETRHFVPFAYLLTALLFARSGLYATRAQRPGMSRIVGSLFEVAFVALIFAIVSGEHFSSFYIFYGSLAFAVLYVSTLRAGYERITGVILHAAGHGRRAVIVGTGKHVGDVAYALDGKPRHTPLEVVGYLSPRTLPASELRDLGRLEGLERVLTAERIDEVIIADPDFPQVEAVELVDRCHRRGVRVRIAPSTMEILIQRAEFVPGQAVPLFELGPPVFDGVDFALKRTFDVIGAVLLLTLLSPLLLAIVIAVRVSSRGPIVYRSTRRGIGQRPFACLKFRTMHTDADERQADLEAQNEASGALFKIRDDPRLTPVGPILRRFSLDELPQLINVIRGEMSLVGPRPLPERDYEMLEEWHRKRYLVLPGITGLWQVSGRSELDFDDLVNLDFIYLERWSLALDLTILLKTVPAVITRRGAY
jgi:exopolysaccharide biosynthesis polyprenyl glycosylphosphotransferase